MTAAQADGFEELKIVIRPIDGPTCAQCGQRIGIAQLNGHSFSVAPKALVIQGGTILLSLHLCPSIAPAPAPTRKPAQKRR